MISSLRPRLHIHRRMIYRYVPYFTRLHDLPKTKKREMLRIIVPRFLYCLFLTNTARQSTPGSSCCLFLHFWSDICSQAQIIFYMSLFTSLAQNRTFNQVHIFPTSMLLTNYKLDFLNFNVKPCCCIYIYASTLFMCITM